MALRRTARFVLGIIAVILVGVLLPPFVSVTRYRAVVTGALSRAIGREVTAGSVSLRLLPQPGVAMENVVIHEDPRFGAEPMLRANEVVATLRISSLWRGRFEVGSLSLKEPSLNLVRSADGHWNIETLLQRASQTPTAPTSKTRPESRPRFPYIEASSGRINFKVGEEKKVWALTDADFGLWLASEDEWRTRLVAKPVRTDNTLSDTGTIRIDGSLQRTSRVETGLIKLRVALEQAQLGQLSTLIYGHDRGWRGTTNASIEVSGTPAQLTLSGAASIDQFRRYDIMPPDSLRLQAQCVAQYAPAREQLAGIECHLPADNGELSARGSVSNMMDQPRLDLSLVARDVPMSYAIAFARRAKKDLPSDLSASGLLNAALTIRTGDDNRRIWDGGGSTRDFTLHSSVLQTPLRLGAVEFAMQPEIVPAAGRAARPALLPTASTYRVVVPAFPLPLGAAKPPTVEGSFTREGYSFTVSGEMALPRLFQIAHAVGIPAPAQAISGGASAALQVSGAWQGFRQPLVTGTGRIENVRSDLPGVAAPLEIAHADVVLSGDRIEAQGVTFRAGAVAGSGSFRLPRACASNPNCEIEFTAHSDRVSLDDLNRLLNPRLRSEPWYRRIAGGGTPAGSFFAGLHASGQISVGRLGVKNVVLQNVAGSVSVNPGTVEFTSGVATLFGGTVRGDWRADFTGGEPSYSGSGTLQRVALAQISSAMRDNWATGATDGRYRVTLAGWNAADLIKSAAGSLDFAWKDGSLRHLTLAPAHGAPAHLDAAGALRIKIFRGRASLHDGVLTISDGQMETPSGVYAVSGTATRERELSLTFSLNRGQQYNVGGTLAEPRVQAVALPAQHTSVAR